MTAMKQSGNHTSTHTHVTHAYMQGDRNAAGGHVHPLTPAPHQTQIIPPSPIPHTRAAARAALAVQEPLALAGTTLKFIDTPWVGTHAPTPEADISSAIVSVGKGPQENLDRVSKIWMGGGADDDCGGMELLTAKDEPQEEDQAPAEDEEEPDTVEGEAEGEHEEDEEPSATEAGGPEGSNESGGTGGYDVSGGEKGACGGEGGAPLGA